MQDLRLNALARKLAPGFKRPRRWTDESVSALCDAIIARRKFRIRYDRDLASRAAAGRRTLRVLHHQRALIQLVGPDSPAARAISDVEPNPEHAEARARYNAALRAKRPSHRPARGIYNLVRDLYDVLQAGGITRNIDCIKRIHQLTEAHNLHRRINWASLRSTLSQYGKRSRQKQASEQRDVLKRMPPPPESSKSSPSR